MYLYEYEAKDVFTKYGIPLGQNGIATNPAEAGMICAGIGKPVVVKAQVMAGGRGKAGLILPAADPEAAAEAAARILGKEHHGEQVKTLLIEEQIEIAREIYASITMDFAEGKPVMMVSAQGGVEIESLAVSNPELLLKEHIDPWREVFGHRLRDLWRRAGFHGGQVVELENILDKLVKVFQETDALTAEINPLVITREGKIMAADAKLILDDEASFRSQIIRNVYRTEINPLEKRAGDLNVTYVSLEEGGEIGIIAGGAGLSMATMDAVYALGAKPAAFIDLGGGISRERMKESLHLMTETPKLRGIMINVFGGINNCLTMASGLADFLDEKPTGIKIVVKMRGHEQEEGWRILERYGIPTVKFETTDVAIRLLMQVLAKEVTAGGTHHQ
ncbi:succinyl-CoA synthetase (ADP-forming) beta subunit [Desulfitobacterium chlororespirans DSM 11544]|uniref:Succinyl-CoA synthetase (ADP-forming) beta subunit n=2 Tax=Desulfitobacterium chlororespirans TaxID=51616 RepID=A0A1M7SE43_9FIRM|nr:succinyl-CoA synthetase (ADP-forming) beta subunit [Desulfitobacterium chlororespirans DSM 11544]